MPQDLKEWKETFAIFEKYPSGDDGIVRAEHDEVYASLDPRDVSPEDISRLDELGWHDYGTGGFMAFV